MNVITDTQALKVHCKLLAKAPFITVDTEFMRDRTFYSKLCLIQVASPNTQCIIDPLAEGLDLSPFLDVLMNKGIIKVMHASRQDIEIFYALCDAVPAPLFDTQVAAMALGFGDSCGYGALVKGRLNINLDKGARFTDWAKRPLSTKQLNYAMGDVTHLRDLYPGMVKELEDKGRLEWVMEEMQGQLEPSLYTFDSDAAWKRLKIRSPRRDYLAAMKAAAAWREDEAKKRNTPRNRILKDDGIYDLAQNRPTNIKALGNLRGIPRGFERSKGIDRLIARIQSAVQNAETYAPVIEQKRNMPSNLGPTIDMLKTLLRLRSEYQDIAPRLIANAADIEAIAAFGEKAGVAALGGWRRDIFGQDAIDMLAGKIGLRLEGREVVAKRLDD